MTEWRPTADLTALRARAQVLARIRAFFAERDVLEVQTPVLGAHTVTEPQIDSIEVAGHGYLQTSPEYHMKRLLAAGAPSIYQMGPVFRAGESGAHHNPEFTMLEWYRRGFDAARLRTEVAELVAAVLGPGDVETLTYAELVDGGPAGLDPDLWLAQRLQALAGAGRRRVFVVDYPAEQAALARLSSTDPSVAARFEFVVDGIELANGYHELADPVELRARFEADVDKRARLGRARVEIDERLLAAQRHGLPDCAGVALGVDRLVMLALGAARLEQVLTFPADRA